MHCYALALGSNRRHGRHGSPRGVLVAAVAALAEQMEIVARSTIIETAALGPAGRRFANAAVIVASSETPGLLLRRLKRIERAFGRRAGRRWGARALDLDILLWSGGAWQSRRPWLQIPHRELAARDFVLEPLTAIAPEWRLPGEALRVRHALARLRRRRAR